jgi:ABC-type transport system substrate-binding protein
LNELYRRNPKREGLATALGEVTSKLVEQKVEKEQYAAAYQMVQALLEKFPASEAAAQWRTKIQERARERLTVARSHLAAERYREAADEARQALRIWPLKEAKDIWAEAHQRFPRVVVGVTLPGGRTEANPMVDWAARRSARLFNRSLLEFQGYGPQGGIYECPVGEIERLDLGLRWSIRLRPDIPWSIGTAVVTGHDVARRLLVMTDPSHPAYRADWADLFARVTVRNVYDVDVELRRAHVHPDGMLQTILRPWNLAAQDDLRAASLGPYVVASAEAAEVRYLSNERYFAASSAQPKEIVERFYPKSRQAVAALKNGEIAVLDRVLPWELETLREQKNLTVEPYAVPTIHCLIPNYDRPFLTRRSFRRALQYGINREQILREQLIPGSPSLGEVISGPFPRGEGIDDPQGYAYNEEVPLRGWHPYLAMTLLTAARHELAPPANKSGEAQSASAGDGQQPSAGDVQPPEAAEPAKVELPPLPELVLAHPPHDVARVACRSIKRQLELIGLTVRLAETDPNAPTAPEGDWDLLFVELAMWEPIIDAKRLLGPQGIVGRASPYMDQALRELEIAEDWRRARERLLHVHRIAHYDLTIIPLWQMTDHFAYQKGLQGVGSKPAMLYQNIESWQSPPWFSEDQP